MYLPIHWKLSVTFFLPFYSERLALCGARKHVYLYKRSKVVRSTSSAKTKIEIFILVVSSLAQQICVTFFLCLCTERNVQACVMCFLLICLGKAISNIRLYVRATHNRLAMWTVAKSLLIQTDNRHCDLLCKPNASLLLFSNILCTNMRFINNKFRPMLHNTCTV